MKIKSEFESWIALNTEVSKVMNISDKTLRKWNKTAAPNQITRESLLVDTLMAKGWRLVDFSTVEEKE